jgi:serpin B
LGSVFSSEGDFSGVTREPGFHVSQILHDASLTVDQYGTEAAAATLAVKILGIPPPKPTELTIDRPFLFAIVHRASGVILFLGKVGDPSRPT